MPRADGSNLADIHRLRPGAGAPDRVTSTGAANERRVVLGASTGAATASIRAATELVLLAAAE